MECARKSTNPYIPLTPEEERRAEPTKNRWAIKGCAFLVLFLLGLLLYNTGGEVSEGKESEGTNTKDYGKYQERRHLPPLKIIDTPKNVDPKRDYRRYHEQSKHHEQYRPGNDLKRSRARGTTRNFSGFLSAELGVLAVKNPNIMAVIMVVVGFIGSVNFVMDLLGHVGLLSARIKELYGVKLDMPLVDETATQHGKYYSVSCDGSPCRSICAEVANKYGKYCVRHIVLRVIAESNLSVDRVVSLLTEKYGKPKYEEQTRRFLYTDSISGRTIIVLSPQGFSPHPSNKNSESQHQSPGPSSTCAEMKGDNIVKIIATGRLWDKEII